MTLTPRAKRVIDLAYDEARNLNNNYIGTEHLLLGLIREDGGLAGRILDKLRVRLEDARREVMVIQEEETSGDPKRRTGRKPEAAPESVLCKAKGLTESGRMTIFEAHRIAFQAGRLLVFPEDLLLALIRNPESFANRALGKLKVDFAVLEEQIQQIPADAKPDEDSFSTLSKNARWIVRSAASIADAMGNELVAPEHLLLEMLRSPKYPFGYLLAIHGVDYQAAYDAIEELRS